MRADAFVDGTVQRSADKVRATGASRECVGRAVWYGARCSKNPRAIPLSAVEDAIAERIAFVCWPGSLPRYERVRLTPGNPRSPQAHRDYLMGRYYWNKRRSRRFEQAQRSFSRAIERDPAYAEAYAGLADTYLLTATFSGRPFQEVAPNAEGRSAEGARCSTTVWARRTRRSPGLFWHRFQWHDA